MIRRKLIPILLLVLIVVIASCNSENAESPEEIIHIDVLEAFNEQESMKLSDFVDGVEYIPLESTKESYFRLAYDYTIGKKYIMVADGERAQLVLFDRKGRFIRTIGKAGKGPGEFNEPRTAEMDPKEEFVFVADPGTAKLYKYSIEGEFIKELSIKDISPARYLNGIEFISDDQFVLINRRPYAPMEGFSSMPVFDKDLNLIKNILPRANDENLVINVVPHSIFTVNPSRMTFWEPYLDTLYTITPGGKAIPTHVIGFSKGGPAHEFITTNRNPNTSSENYISSMMDDGQFIHITGKSDGKWFYVLYNHKTKDIFEIPRPQTCDTNGYFSFAGLENDLYGVATVYMTKYFKSIDRFVSWGRVERITEYYDLDCIREKDVKYPELRDRFLEIAEDPESKYQKIIVLMKLK